MSTRDEYVTKMKAQLDEMNARIDKLAAKSETAKKEVKTRYQQELADLRAQSKAANGKLTELKASTEDRWDSTVTELEKISSALKHSYNYFKSQL